ncbi:hypothetical protein [Porphyromonas sp.]|uniref:hypothetical protein n=1 Tax=Porphyromonas sp. TaxID=1924944 RepID=UPI00399532E2
MTYLRTLATMALTVLMLCCITSCDQEPNSNSSKDQLDSLQLAGTRWAGRVVEEYQDGDRIDRGPYEIVFFTPSRGQVAFPIDKTLSVDKKDFTVTAYFQYKVDSYEISFTTNLPELVSYENISACKKYLVGKWLVRKATNDEIILCRDPRSETIITLKRVER